MTSKEIITALQQGRDANVQTNLRQGSLIELGDFGNVIMTGDLHDHQRNYERLVNLANLERNPHTHLVLHELIHRSHSAIPNLCHSYQFVAQAAALKARFPDQVHYLMGNHEMAQASRDEVLKNGQPMVQALLDGARDMYGADMEDVMQALDEFILSLPLAARTKNRIWLSHSLPSPRHTKTFDHTIFEKPVTHEMIAHNESLRALLWDRRHSDEALAELSDRWNVDQFIIGHQAQETGFARPLTNMLILASDHNHGHYLQFDLAATYTPDQLLTTPKPLAALA